jgi:hypothetical protein
MDLEEEFIKETGLKCTIPNFIHSDGYYNDEYVEFLENKISKLTERTLELSERLQGQIDINREQEIRLRRLTKFNC